MTQAARLRNCTAERPYRRWDEDGLLRSLNHPDRVPEYEWFDRETGTTFMIHRCPHCQGTFYQDSSTGKFLSEE